MSNPRTVHLVLIASLTLMASVVGPRPSRAADENVPPAAAAPTKDKGKVAAGKPKPPKVDKLPGSTAEVTLKGDLTCAHCSLHEGTACQNVLRVKEAAGEAKYYLAKNGVSEQNHGKVCGGSAAATVTGKLSTEGEKKIITPSALTFD